MRLVEREVADTLPGTTHTTRHVLREWICPECDYFEDASEAGSEA